MIELAVVLIFASFFWPVVIIWSRHLEACACMDAMRADPRDVADLEAGLPDVRDRLRRRR